MPAPTGFIDMELVGDDKQVLEMLRRLDTCFSATGMAAFLNNNVTPWLQQRAKARFGSEGDDASGKWAPLAQSTIDIRTHYIQRGEISVGPSHPINVRTRDMETFITQGRGEVLSSSASTTLYYPQRRVPTRKGLDQKVKRAQNGDSRTPRRPVLGVNERDLTKVLMDLSFFIQRTVASA